MSENDKKRNEATAAAGNLPLEKETEVNKDHLEHTMPEDDDMSGGEYEEDEVARREEV